MMLEVDLLPLKWMLKGIDKGINKDRNNNILKMST
jgi:hypothetical protein